jgi:hypothetical protein
MNNQSKSNNYPSSPPQFIPSVPILITSFPKPPDKHSILRYIPKPPDYASILGYPNLYYWLAKLLSKPLFYFGSVPIVLTSMLNFMMNIVDLAMVGHLGA